MNSFYSSRCRSLVLSFSYVTGFFLIVLQEPPHLDDDATFASKQDLDIRLLCSYKGCARELEGPTPYSTLGHDTRLKGTSVEFELVSPNLGPLIHVFTASHFSLFV